MFLRNALACLPNLAGAQPRVARQAFREALNYNLDDPLCRLTASTASDRVRWSALQRFRTQLEPLDRGLGPVVPSRMLEHHTEQLLLSTGPVRS
jgi:hypothetical protein